MTPDLFGVEVEGGKGVGGHTKPFWGVTDDWLTPPEIIKALGKFDLDPCAAPDPRPWDTATQHYTLPKDGLAMPWRGRVWMNPPYGPATGKWLSKLADHGNGIALTFARTETSMFHRQVWEKADALLFLEGRLYFHHPDGRKASANAGGPSVLIAYGRGNADALKRCVIKGAYVRLRFSE